MFHRRCAHHDIWGLGHFGEQAARRVLNVNALNWDPERMMWLLARTVTSETANTPAGLLCLRKWIHHRLPRSDKPVRTGLLGFHLVPRCCLVHILPSTEPVALVSMTHVASPEGSGV